MSWCTWPDCCVKRKKGLSRNTLKKRGTCSAYVTPSRRCVSPIRTGLRVMERVSIPKICWGTVCCRDRIVSCRSWMGQRFGVGPPRSGDGIGPSWTVHFLSAGIYERFFRYRGQKGGVCLLRRHCHESAPNCAAPSQCH